MVGVHCEFADGGHFRSPISQSQKPMLGNQSSTKWTISWTTYIIIHSARNKDDSDKFGKRSAVFQKPLSQAMLPRSQDASTLVIQAWETNVGRCERFPTPWITYTPATFQAVTDIRWSCPTTRGLVVGSFLCQDRRSIVVRAVIYSACWPFTDILNFTPHPAPWIYRKIYSMPIN